MNSDDRCPSPTTVDIPVSPIRDRDFATPTSPIRDFSIPNSSDFPPPPVRARASTAATIHTLDPINENYGNPLSNSISRRDSTASTFRLRRTQTVKASRDYPSDTVAGAEPGLDVDAESSTDGRIQSLRGPSQVTVVEYSEDKIEVTDFDDEDKFVEFLRVPRQDWVKVRWINCNGLSWKVIQPLAQHYKLHSLALEDITISANNNRPKCDWYSDHCFVILPLLKLLDRNALHNNSDDSDSDTSSYKPPSFWRRIFRTIIHPSSVNRGLPDTSSNVFTRDPEKRPYFDETTELPERNIIRTLQQAYGGPNIERIAYMEAHSSLEPLDKIVHVEQVSAFLTSEGTVISFFEISGDDVEPPILQRLESQRTLLRTSSDPSMMLQAIIDAVVDLSFPVIGAYQDTIASLELIVLTDPSVKQSQDLYILTSELSLLKGTLAPIGAVITSLRDHQRSIAARVKGLQTAEISEMTRIYLGDVLDHVILILDNLDMMKRSADNMIDLIFNTIGSMQNESMKQLTTITIVFLPITFLAGYFGMNFEHFPSVKDNSDTFFWKIAGPVIVVTLLLCMREVLGRGIVNKFRGRAIKVAGRRRRGAKME